MEINGDRRWLERVYYIEKFDRNYSNYDDWQHRCWYVQTEYGFLNSKEECT
jgi:hypothetical protein